MVGSGHNALVAACYLAREGLDVEVVERDTVLGGAVSTVERWPGYAVDRGSSAHIMIRHTGIVEDLRLAECGLRYLDMDPWGFAPFGPADDQQALTFSVDLDATCASIAAMCGDRDADAYRAFVTDWGARNEAVFAAFQDVPTAGRLGRHLWGAGKATDVGGLEMSRQFLQPADQLLDEHFADERLKTALGLARRAVRAAGARGRHRRPGRLERADAPDAARPCSRRLRRADRGAGRAAAPARRHRCASATARPRSPGPATGSPASRRRPASTSAARAVVAGCHVLTTLELLGDQALLDRATTAVRVGNGIGMVVRLGTNDLPRYPSAAGASPYSAMQLLAPSRTHLRAAHGEFTAGRTPTEPAVLLMTFSALDPTIAPEGKHNISAWAQWHPYELSTGEQWDDIRDREADKIVAQVEKAAPGFAEQHRAHARADAAGPRARAGPAPRQRHARRDGAGLDVRVPAAARAGGLPYAGARPVPHRRVDPSGRRGVRRVRPHRGAASCWPSGGEWR